MTENDKLFVSNRKRKVKIARKKNIKKLTEELANDPS